MRRFRPAIRALAAGALPALFAPAEVPAQFNRPAPAVDARDLSDLAGRLADRARLLADEVDAEVPGRDPRSRLLREDARELALASEEFRRAALGRGPAELRRVYGGIAVTWQDLLGRLPRSGPIDRAAARVDELVSQLAGTLDVAPIRYGPVPPAAPDGLAEARRLARSLSDRADDLSAAIRSELLGAPGGNRLALTAADLARASADYRRLAESGDLRPDRVDAAVRPIAALADRLEADLSVTSQPRSVRSAWSSFRPVLGLVRNQVDYALGPNAPSAPPPVPAFPDPAPPIRTIPDAGLPPLAPVPGLIPGLVQVPVPAPSRLVPSGPGGRVVFRPVMPPPQVEERAAILLEQVEMFLGAFVHSAGVVPEGGQFIADATRLRDATADFLAAAQGGLDAGQLALRFRDIDALYQRLARRTARVSKGRGGPNIDQIGVMGQNVAALGANLAYPVDPNPYPLFP